MPNTADPKNSTNVRPLPIALRATRAGLRVLAPRAPELAARWAERLFLTARRHDRPFWERDALRSSRADRVAHEGGWLPTWTWSPPSSALDDWRSGTETRHNGALGTAIRSAPAVLLVHGWEGRGSQLASFVPELLARGLRVVAFDAPGHGDSSLRRASIVEHARAIRSVASTIGPLQAVIGHSVGGAATLLATRDGLDVKRVAILAAPASPERFASTFASVLGLDDALKGAVIARLERRYTLRFDELDLRLDALRLEAPLLVVHDRTDTVVAYEDGETLARTAPNGELLTTDGLGHRAILRAPEVVRAVSSFVATGTDANREPTTPSFAETLDGELFMRDTRWSRRA